MKKKKKINKRKFISRIFFLILLIIIITVTTKNLGKKEIPKFGITVIVNNENITETLNDEPYLNKDNVLYLSINDVKHIFDPNIFYEDGKIITTSETKVAAIDVNANNVQLNSANITLDNGILDYGENPYIPISEMKNIYGIEVFEAENSAIVSFMNEEYITIKVTKKTNVKEEKSFFSKTLQKLQKDTELIFLGEEENWIKVLTLERKYWIHKE